MSPLPPEILAELQKDYLDSFADSIKEMREKVKTLDWASIRFHFHKFAGSGGTYGLHDITEVGRAVENYIDNTPTVSGKVIEDAILLFEKIIECHKSGKTLTAETKNEVLKKMAA
jgi:HPt (histidine-containing phosphotransfer) domain-containing protein